MRNVIFVLILFISGEAGIIRDWIENRSGTEIKKLSNLIYGEDQKQKLDVYLSSHPKNAPIIVMVHGGAWSMGDKKSDDVVLNKMNRWVSQGAIFVSLNYRLVPKVTTLKQAEDVARALAYIQNRAASWGGDPEKVVLMGHSAGAHLVSLVSVTAKKWSTLGVKPWLGTVSLDTATMDLVQTMERKHFDFYDLPFGNSRDYWIQNSPYYQLGSSTPPMLLVCSTLREDRPCEDSKLFMSKGLAMGLRIEMSEQPLNHGEINNDLGKPGGYTERVEQFMRSLGIRI